MSSGSRADDALIALAVVTRPHGLRGEVRLHLHNPDSPLILELDRALLRQEGAGTREIPVDVRQGPKGVLLARLEGVDGRDAAEGLRGAELCVRRADLPAIDDDEWYHVDLLGLEVRGPGGTRVGEVIGVIPYPSVDCLRVQSPDGVREVPMVEPWLEAVDVDGGVVVVGDLGDLPVETPGKRQR